MKLCLAASTGGHYEQLMMLRPLSEKHSCFVLTERTSYALTDQKLKTYYVTQMNRKEWTVAFKLVGAAFKSLYIILRERPDAIICTGVLAMVPMCLLMKLFGKKLIYIESFAKTDSPTLTGKLLCKYADQFYVQWESMLAVYPNAIYVGGIY